MCVVGKDQCRRALAVLYPFLFSFVDDFVSVFVAHPSHQWFNNSVFIPS